MFQEWMASRPFVPVNAICSSEVLYHFALKNKQLANCFYGKSRKYSLFNVDVMNIDHHGNYFHARPLSRFDADFCNHFAVTSTNSKMTTTILLNEDEYSLN